MSLYAALFSGVSGLNAYSSALGIISDNITNINTVGYKATVAEFSTLVAEPHHPVAIHRAVLRRSRETLSAVRACRHQHCPQRT